MYVHAYTKCICICIHVHIKCISMCIYIYIYIHTHTHKMHIHIPYMHITHECIRLLYTESGAFPPFNKKSEPSPSDDNMDITNVYTYIHTYSIHTNDMCIHPHIYHTQKAEHFRPSTALRNLSLRQVIATQTSQAHWNRKIECHYPLNW